MLRVRDLHVSYGKVSVLRNVSLEVDAREIVSIIGSNGSGKTTLLKAILGQVTQDRGSMEFLDKNLDGLATHERVKLGIGYVPEGRGIFPNMTVLENLEVAVSIWTRDGKIRKERIDGALEMFPILGDRRKQKAGTLSGGEAQMLAIGRCLVGNPKLMMFDEPSLGLAPIIVAKILERIKEINQRGITVILVEQNVRHSLEISHRGYVLENGEIALKDRSHELLKNEHIKRAYLGL
jgi:branched-chain amino acid transport system ATP-binding protein